LRIHDAACAIQTELVPGFLCGSRLYRNFSVKEYAMVYTFNTSPREKEVQHIRDELKLFNDAIAGDDNHTPLSIVAYGDDGEIIGGIIGGTYWGWLYIDRLWIHRDHRKTGIGSSLVRQLEDIARQRGCEFAHLDTMDFQAPGFYEKLGYTRKFAFDDLPKGHSRIFMAKKI